MKTPKRDYKKARLCPATGDLDEYPVWEEEARWKRKNRVAQLKRSLHRYKHGTNLPFYCHELHAYLLLQALHRPTEKASAKKWESYIQKLSEIIAHLEESRTWAHLAKRRKQDEEA